MIFMKAQFLRAMLTEVIKQKLNPLSTLSSTLESIAKSMENLLEKSFLFYSQLEIFLVYLWVEWEGNHRYYRDGFVLRAQYA